MRGRKLIICKCCGEEKINFGFGMCSPCLRKWKRQTRPIYYLRTCWGEIKRRSTQKVPNRTYTCYGQEFCTKTEFVDKFLNDPNFLTLYKNWQENNFKRGYAPSIDRIDSSKGYELNNLQFLSNIENTRKESSLPTLVLSIHNDIFIFDSLSDAAKFLKTTSGKLAYHKLNNIIFKKTYYIYNLDEVI
jgi:hypothetical protein